jgi:hypothetical protein
LKQKEILRKKQLKESAKRQPPFPQGFFHFYSFESYVALKKKRDFEIEGFTSDILLLRKQLKTLEKAILKYAPLEDKEFALLNIARNTGKKAIEISTSLQNLKVIQYFRLI